MRKVVHNTFMSNEDVSEGVGRERMECDCRNVANDSSNTGTKCRTITYAKRDDEI